MALSFGASILPQNSNFSAPMAHANVPVQTCARAAQRGMFEAGGMEHGILTRLRQATRHRDPHRLHGSYRCRLAAGRCGRVWRLHRTSDTPHVRFVPFALLVLSTAVTNGTERDCPYVHCCGRRAWRLGCGAPGSCLADICRRRRRYVYMACTSERKASRSDLTIPSHPHVPTAAGTAQTYRGHREDGWGWGSGWGWARRPRGAEHTSPAACSGTRIPR
jgi:hypothetical protein